jgi:hypothetical protein
MGEASNSGRLAATLGGAVVAAPASYVVQRTLGAWGVLDDVSDALGYWLKIHVSPAAAGWTIALLLVLAIYGLILWLVWTPRQRRVSAQARSGPTGGGRGSRKALEMDPSPGGAPPRCGTVPEGRLSRALARERVLQEREDSVNSLARRLRNSWTNFAHAVENNTWRFEKTWRPAELRLEARQRGIEIPPAEPVDPGGISSTLQKLDPERSEVLIVAHREYRTISKSLGDAGREITRELNEVRSTIRDAGR